MREDEYMTKVDEGAAVPKMCALERGKLARALDRDHVVAGLLFGSQASGNAGPLSDVDVAVWLDPNLPREKLAALRSELVLAAVETLGTDEVDVVVLNGAPPLIRHRALKGGTRLFDRDPRARVRLETAALLDYFDTAPLRETLAAGRRRRIQEGRFGRRPLAPGNLDNLL
jgi:predicted nucleotidyltransferase